MLLAELVVVVAVAGRDVDEARARVGGDEIGGEDLRACGVVEERVGVGETDEVGTFPGSSENGTSRSRQDRTPRSGTN